MKKILYVFTLLLLTTRICGQTTYNVWNHPEIINSNCNGLTVERLSFDDDFTRVYLNARKDVMKATKINKMCCIEDESGKRYSLMKCDTVRNNMQYDDNIICVALCFEKCKNEPMYLDVLNLTGEYGCRIDGIHSGFSGHRIPSMPVSDVKYKITSKPTATQSYIAGKIQNYIPSVKYKYVMVYNEADSSGHHPYWFGRVQNDGSFSIAIDGSTPKILQADFGFIKGVGKIPVIAMPGETTSLTLSGNPDEGYRVSYKLPATAKRLVSEKTLAVLPKYPTANPYQMVNSISLTEYDKRLCQQYKRAYEAANYYTWKYKLTSTEHRVLQTCADIDYYINRILLQKLCTGADYEFLTSADKKRCVSLLSSSYSDMFPGYDYLSYLMTTSGLFAEYADVLPEDRSVGGTNIQRISKSSVFESCPSLKEIAKTSDLYHLVFVNDQFKTKVLKMENLMIDYRTGGDISFIFVGCKDLFKQDDTQFYVERLQSSQPYINLTVDEYYALKESVGNIPDYEDSKTLDKDGYVLSETLRETDEFEFRRILRRMKKQIVKK